MSSSCTNQLHLNYKAFCAKFDAAQREIADAVPDKDCIYDYPIEQLQDWVAKHIDCLNPENHRPCPSCKKPIYMGSDLPHE